MSSHVIPVAIFGWDIECLYYTSLKYQFICMVEKGSATDVWVSTFLPDDAFVRYSFPAGHNVDAELREILVESNIMQTLHDRAIHYIITTEIITEELEIIAKQHGLTWITTSAKTHERFENKIVFDRLLSAHKLPKPSSELYKRGDKLPFIETVLQKAESWGSEGTFFVNSETELNQLTISDMLKNETVLLARQRIRGTSYGVSLFISSGVIAISALRIQCFQKTPEGLDMFLGIQWVPFKKFSKKLQTDINTMLKALGDVLYKERYLGFANIDFIVDHSDNLFIIECNARYSAANFHIAWQPQLLHSLKTYELFIDSVIETKDYPDSYRVYEVPDMDFSGSMIDLDLFPEIYKGEYILHDMKPLGLYEYQGVPLFRSPNLKVPIKDAIIYFSEYSEQHTVKEYKTIGFLYSSITLFNQDGMLNNTGSTVKSFFEYI